MSESEAKTRVERTFYPNGQLKSETPYVGDEVSGVVRRWHENGIPKSEIPKIGSVIHGVAREWNSEGRLIEQSECDHGVGVSRSFYSNGQLRGETYVRQNNIPHGRLRVWDEGGELLGEQFFVLGRHVSKKKYKEACVKDLSLPRYDVDEGQIPFSERYIERAAEQAIISVDDYPDALDALEWLQESSEESIRTLGEFASAKESIELVRIFLERGATKVLAAHIKAEEFGETASELLVGLPSEPTARRNVLEFCNEQNQVCGYSPIMDSGQRFVHVALD